jgi:hypothetical protein
MLHLPPSGTSRTSSRCGDLPDGEQAEVRHGKAEGVVATSHIAVGELVEELSPNGPVVVVVLPSDHQLVVVKTQPTGTGNDEQPAIETIEKTGVTR